MHMKHRAPIISSLEVLGLSNNAINIYLFIFEHGNMTMSSIAKKLSLDRSSTYIAAEQLKQAGLAIIDESKRPKLVSVPPPKKILSCLEQHIQMREDAFDEIRNNLGLLKAAYNSEQSAPSLQSFSGSEGLRNIMNDILDSTEELLLLFTNQTHEKQVFSKKDHDHFIRKRKIKGTHINVIACDDEYAQKLQSQDASSNRTTKIIRGPSPFKSEVYVYEDKVAMLSFASDVIGFIVQSKDYSEFVRWQFDQIWSQL